VAVLTGNIIQHVVMAALVVLADIYQPLVAVEQIHIPVTLAVMAEVLLVARDLVYKVQLGVGILTAQGIAHWDHLVVLDILVVLKLTQDNIKILVLFNMEYADSLHQDQAVLVMSLTGDQVIIHVDIVQENMGSQE
jgi:hypothetical protein